MRPHMKDIELGNISLFRAQLMGIAILIIILFHVNLPRFDTFFGLKRIGNLGVDMFFLLSGIGLWFSWVKTPSFRHFLTRRYLRVYPAWLLMACLYYIPRFHGGDWLAWLDLLLDITINWDFWLHDELTFWYIPATMMLYLFAPAYMELIRRHPLYRWLPVGMIAWCVIVQWVAPVHQAVGHLEIFWSRVPIFFIGINMGEMIRQKSTIDGTTIWMIVLFFVGILASCVYLEQYHHGKFPLFIERMLYIPLTVTSILILSLILRHLPKWCGSILAFLGILSLEIYLIHSNFVLTYLHPLRWSYWPTFLTCVAITLPAAWVLSKLTTLARNRISVLLPPSLR